MLSLQRLCHPTEPIPEARIWIQGRYWLWVQEINQNPKSVRFSLSSEDTSLPVTTVPLALHQEFVFGPTTIKLMRVARSKCVLRFDAPPHVIILREELL